MLRRSPGPELRRWEPGRGPQDACLELGARCEWTAQTHIDAGAAQSLKDDEENAVACLHVERPSSRVEKSVTSSNAPSSENLIAPLIRPRL